MAGLCCCGREVAKEQSLTSVLLLHKVLGNAVEYMELLLHALGVLRGLCKAHMREHSARGLSALMRFRSNKSMDSEAHRLTSGQVR